MADEAKETSMLVSIIHEIIYSPLNLGLVVIIGFLIYKIIRDRFEVTVTVKKPEPELPKLRRDFTVAELRQFDGNQPDGRVLVAVNGKVYDVTKGKRFYGPGGPYATFAGRDASRNLATFSVAANDNEEYDDLSDLNGVEMESVREWEMQFNEKYDLVGKLLRKGEQPTNYEDEEEETSTDVNPGKDATSAAAPTGAAPTAAAVPTATAGDVENSTKAENADSEGLRKRTNPATNTENIEEVK